MTAEATTETFSFQLPVTAQQAHEDARGNEFKMVGRLKHLVEDQLSALDLMPSKDLVEKAAGELFDGVVSRMNLPFAADLKRMFLWSVDKLYDKVAANKAQPA